MRFADGDVYESPYKDDKMHGKWVFRYPDGTVTRMTYRNGEIVE